MERPPWLAPVDRGSRLAWAVEGTASSGQGRDLHAEFLRDALFGLVLVASTAVGIAQELRAKRTLDRLEVVNAPRARAVRDGAVVELAVGQLVLDDLLEVGPAPGRRRRAGRGVGGPGGRRVAAHPGEAEPVAKRPGELVLSESFAAAGSGRYRAARVGREAYAARLTEEARRFTLASSELRAGIDRILYRPPRTGVPGIGRAAHDGILPP